MLQEKIIKQKKLDFNNLKDDVRKIFPELSEFELEKIVERNLCTNIFSEIKDVDEWFKKIIETSNTSVEEISINECTLGMLMIKVMFHTIQVDSLKLLD